MQKVAERLAKASGEAPQVLPVVYFSLYLMNLERQRVVASHKLRGQLICLHSEPLPSHNTEASTSSYLAVQEDQQKFDWPTS